VHYPEESLGRHGIALRSGVREEGGLSRLYTCPAACGGSRAAGAAAARVSRG